MPEVPPPSQRLLFLEWTHVLVDRLRELLPDVVAARRGKIVVLRRPQSARVVTISEDQGTFWVATADAGAPMARLCDSERHDAHTARTFAKTIAGGFDAALSRPEP